MTHPIHTPRRRRFALLATALITLLALFSPSVGAQDEGEGEGEAARTSVLRANRVDAAEPTVEAVFLADNYRFDASSISVTENGVAIDDSSAQLASNENRPMELVLVIDTRARLSEGNVLGSILTQSAAAVRRLPPGTTVAVVDAGDSAVLRVSPTTDLESAAAAIEAIEPSRSSTLFNALDRASTLISADDLRLSTVVVFSGGTDIGSTAGRDQAMGALVQAEAQVISVRYRGGEPALDEIVTKTGGLILGAETPDTIGVTVDQAMAAASDRIILRYGSQAEDAVIRTTTVNIESASVAYSHAPGVTLTKPVNFPPREIAEPSGFAFFRSSLGLYLTIALAFVGIGLGIYALGLLFAGGESSLEGLINRYSGAELGDELSDEQNAIVQTALVQRAVEMSESFAEDRGFLLKIEAMLERANVPLRAGEAMAFWVVISLVSGALGMLFLGGLVGGLIFMVFGGFLQIGFMRFRAGRRIRKFEQQLPDTLQLLAGTLRAGYSLPQGFEAVSKEIDDPMGFELRRVMTEARLGRELEDALAAAAERLSSADFAWAVMAIGIQREVGGNLNELLMTVSDTMVARERLKGEVAALTAEGKASAILLGGLPVGLGFVMWVMNPEYINLLFTETLGNILLGLGILAGVVGFAWMRKVMMINV